MTIEQEQLMRTAFAPIRQLEPTEAEVIRILSRVERGPSRTRGVRAWRPTGDWRQMAAPALSVFVLLVGGLVAVPATRAAIGDAADAFTSWAGGDPASAPGRALPPGVEAPSFLYDSHFATEPRVVASTGGYELFAYREPSGGIGFQVSNGSIGGGFSAAELDGSPLTVIGPALAPTSPQDDLVPLVGLASDSVASVELSYESGSPLMDDEVEGGFVMLAEPSRGPLEVTALDPDGKVIGRQKVDDSPHPGPRIDWSEYSSQP